MRDARLPALWDTAYHAEQNRQLDYDSNDEDLWPCFSIAQVLGGVFDIASRLYGIRCEVLETVPTWHERVAACSVVSESGELLAWLYADLYTRDRKRLGTWCFENMFHGFGHAMRHCLSEVEFRISSRRRVARDFVELPSQIVNGSLQGFRTGA